MTIKLLTIAKTRLPFLKDAESEYIKRLSPFTKVETVILPAEKNGTPKEIIEKEGNKLLDKIKPTDFVICLDKDGKNPTSEQLAKQIESWQQSTSSLTFIIGGTYGLSDQIKKRGSYTLSLSNLTFTHELSRTILLEQIYRAFMILNNKPYHY